MLVSGRVTRKHTQSSSSPKLYRFSVTHYDEFLGAGISRAQLKVLVVAIYGYLTKRLSKNAPSNRTREKKQRTGTVVIMGGVIVTPPEKLTLNLKMEVYKMILLCNWVILRLHYFSGFL